MNGKVPLRFAWLLVVVTAWILPVSAGETFQGEVLYNGIRLPTVWPPVVPLTREPRPAPYLQQPPEMIPIDMGRQLLVDDFLVQETTLHRVFHRPEYHPANPVLQPDKPWDKQGKASAAMVFSDGVAYESLLLGLFSIWQGPENGTCAALKIQKRNEVLLGFSRDGFHWHRPDRRPFLQVNPVKDAWNWGNVQSAGGGCVVVGDKLYFYFSGRALCSQFWDGGANTGLAVLRRGGFASLDTGATPGVLTTRPVCFHGKRLFVNAAVDRGELTVEILDRQGQAIAPFTRANCLPLTLDKTLAEVNFRDVGDLSPLAGQPVRLRFHLRNGSLYSFWVSPDASGASHGYVAAGGPGFAEAVDTSGTAAYVAAEKIVLTGGVKEPQTSGNTAVIPVTQHGMEARHREKVAAARS